ncbi:MAG: DNA-binding protein [Armatimonadetes bacterium CG2_30_59_28]|nr:type II toxin-antitoxin system VapC family toxin [Armatimonadota bacterium]OIO96832.1 MAG: DNA-binding protein [Armatimonadetes bacterium CG2_30_59_28]PIU62233.1 MAG: DNA-binding protein [Armatimonadetes bacterium CG07_land_8_20_14_0_80_59_28]PIX40754.1 MAG: DNA-binding protein [Armatimonadetes bacterium CG_4_8_14_3_um_filter_58_9]PIY41908.1 MAG: DNA-binding protein [Armatimonadetes bacterium CG_4_10_14_3_um_filter_59_10]PJB67235.1 MAG: DNA-binding protein [Armatimonadetes bacterium CG_4_9_
METVYLETTIVSYMVSDPSRDLIIAGHQQITRDWWADRRQFFSCSVSQQVVDEASKGDADQAARRLAILHTLPKLPITPTVSQLAEELVQSGAIPPKAAGDAVHVAVATVAGVGYVLTWNCRHIANAQVLKQVANVCAHCGYELPSVCTPEELMGGDTDV